MFRQCARVRSRRWHAGSNPSICTMRRAICCHAQTGWSSLSSIGSTRQGHDDGHSLGIAGVGIGLAALLASRPAHAGCEEKQEVKVVTYNVLSPPLARKSHFPSCRPEDLEAENRLPKVLSRLEEAIASDTVIALQEVDLGWAGKLHTFFAERDYCVVFGQYGKEFNGYMGVMLAWPRRRYEAKDVEICRVSDTAPKGTWPKAKMQTKFGTFSKPEINKIIGCYPPDFEAYFDEWALARDRMNEAVFVRLQPRGSLGGSFVVSTYHMPCLFGSAPKVRVMNIHVHLLLAQLKKFANGDPAVLMGDFNIKPQDAAYQFASSGGDLKTAAACPAEFKGLADRLQAEPIFPGGLQSAYREFHGQEPAFTNFALSNFSKGEAFCETLDYIWYSPDGFRVTACPRLPEAKEETDGPFPSPTEPSDHIPVHATLEMR